VRLLPSPEGLQAAALSSGGRETTRMTKISAICTSSGALDNVVGSDGHTAKSPSGIVRACMVARLHSENLHSANILLFVIPAR
jgi:hypothetical protein